MNKINIGGTTEKKKILLFNLLNCENLISKNSGPKPIKIIKKYLKNISKLKRLKFA